MRKRHIWMALAIALMLVPALAAAGEVTEASGPQSLDVSVMGENEVAIWVEGEIGFGTVVAGSIYSREFGMGVTNTWTDGTWDVYVDGGDLQSFTWDCDDQGCTRVLDVTPSVIPITAVTVTGGDQNDWDDETAITSGSTSPDGVTPILTGTAVAYGEFGIDNPQSTVELDLTSLAPDYANYYTELTYTIMHSTP
jgi:hypothetical protein